MTPTLIRPRPLVVPTAKPCPACLAAGRSGVASHNLASATDGERTYRVNGTTYRGGHGRTAITGRAA